MTITAIATDDKGRELFRLEGPPIRPNADGVPRPMLGPSWTTYGPTVEQQFVPRAVFAPPGDRLRVPERRLPPASMTRRR
jgi:hypothetical protein